MSLRMLILKPTCRTWKRRNWRMSEYGSYYQSHFNLTDVHIIQNINTDLAIAFSLDSQVDDNQSNKSKIFWANVRKDLELFNKCCNKNTVILHRKCYSYTWTITILWRKGNLVLGSQTFKICWNCFYSMCETFKLCIITNIINASSQFVDSPPAAKESWYSVNMLN